MSKTISLLTTYLKTRKLIGVSRDIVKETLKILIVGAKILSKRMNIVWDNLLASNIWTSGKVGWFYTGCPWISRRRIFFTSYEGLGNVTHVLSIDDILTGDLFSKWHWHTKGFSTSPLHCRIGVDYIYQSRRRKNALRVLWRHQALIKRNPRSESGTTAKTKYLERSSSRR